MLYPNFLSYILIILTPWLNEKSYKIEQIDTVTTLHVDLHEKLVQWECTCRARQHFKLSWKQNMFFVHGNHYMHSTPLCFSQPCGHALSDWLNIQQQKLWSYMICKAISQLLTNSNRLLEFHLVDNAYMAMIIAILFVACVVQLFFWIHNGRNRQHSIWYGYRHSELPRPSLYSTCWHLFWITKKSNMVEKDTANGYRSSCM